MKRKDEPRPPEDSSWQRPATNAEMTLNRIAMALLVVSGVGVFIPYTPWPIGGVLFAVALLCPSFGLALWYRDRIRTWLKR